MSRQRILILLPALALLACDSPTTAPNGKTPADLPPAAASIVQVTGVIESLAPDDSVNLFIRPATGGRLRLEGADIPRLARVLGAQVTVRGTPDVVDGIFVSSFIVISVNGEAAADGVLLMTDEGGYALRLVADGSMRFLVDPPEELTQHLGERVWVTGAADETPSSYGVIGGTS